MPSGERTRIWMISARDHEYVEVAGDAGEVARRLAADAKHFMLLAFPSPHHGRVWIAPAHVAVVVPAGPDASPAPAGDGRARDALEIAFSTLRRIVNQAHSHLRDGDADAARDLLAEGVVVAPAPADGGAT